MFQGFAMTDNHKFVFVEFYRPAAPVAGGAAINTISLETDTVNHSDNLGRRVIALDRLDPDLSTREFDMCLEAARQGQQIDIAVSHICI